MQRGCGCWKASKLNKHTRIERERVENRAGKKSELTELEESKNNHEDLGKVLFAG